MLVVALVMLEVVGFLAFMTFKDELAPSYYKRSLWFIISIFWFPALLIALSMKLRWG